MTSTSDLLQRDTPPITAQTDQATTTRATMPPTPRRAGGALWHRVPSLLAVASLLLLLLLLLGVVATTTTAFVATPTHARRSSTQQWPPRHGARPASLPHHRPTMIPSPSPSALAAATTRPSDKAGPPPPLPGTTLVLRHPKTGSEVVIVGCVHGSRASEQDVAAVIGGRGAEVVVLELCEARFQSMQAEEEKRRAEARALGGGDQQQHQRGQQQQGEWARGLADFGQSLRDFHGQHGLTQTLLVALLSSSAAAQRFLQAGRPCEFRTSVELAKATGATVVLGDQDLATTLARFRQGWRPDEPGEVLRELASIRDALLGPSGLPSGRKVNVLRVLFTQERYVREVCKVALPVGAIVLGSLRVLESAGGLALASLQRLLPAATLLASSSFLGATTTPPPVDASAAASAVSETAAAATAASAVSLFPAGAAPLLQGMDADALANLGWAAVNVLMVGYFLGMNRYILVERDAFLAQSIAQACRDHPGRRVAAVVGLLHGNGVARHLTATMGFELVDR